jgi:hypothetical protein
MDQHQITFWVKIPIATVHINSTERRRKFDRGSNSQAPFAPQREAQN